jgi:hypothetical protein
VLRSWATGWSTCTGRTITSRCFAGAQLALLDAFAGAEKLRADYARVDES